MVDFHNSISIDLLNTGLLPAANYVNITDDERHIILHAVKSLLFNDGEPWEKKASSSLFDISMGKYDGAKSCELVRAYLSPKSRRDMAGNFGL